MLLSIWTWFIYSFGFPFSNNKEKLFHRLWGTDENLYRSDLIIIIFFFVKYMHIYMFIKSKKKIQK